ncbi:3-deoxy-D-manno-octulosonic acid transferase [Daejeonella lutea]|uniref:3-deoxy-D-manno-octulosonic acid transferase n=1 Tax=Daejeonella lutea TaxID=572036 RepID=A0A1T5CSB5_9SPHI|nr:glycosyltransferase N-terminal domain-containing protein [Daejeonella lutea]SKB62223.1 3-deoxy-D-manno-octulosonic-acid transferase [Daejeonella lutea]
MLFLYDFGIRVYYFLVLLASLKNKKARAWIEGRKNVFNRIFSLIDPSREHAWFHFASLGEFEQGRPVLEEFKAHYPGISIIITFFSPSGYQIRKDYDGADHVFYLPLDTRANAKKFIKLVNPAIAIFTKYEYWFHYFDELQANKIPLYIISGLFRPDQPFFKWYGSLHRNMLHKVSHFFVQNKESKNLLSGLGLNNVSVNGDTRFDRVVKNISEVTEVPIVRDFCSGSKVFIAGSTWPQDELLIASLTSKFPDWKFIIAPHEVDPAHIRSIEKFFPNSVKLSKQKVNTSEQVLIIDNIGMLSSLYQYADLAYIGGGFGVGIHNTQEAAGFGMPVIFGPNYKKFQEAKDLIVSGAFFPISTEDDLVDRMEYLQDEDVRIKLGAIAKDYVLSKAGATKIILEYLKEKRFASL